MLYGSAVPWLFQYVHMHTQEIVECFLIHSAATRIGHYRHKIIINAILHCLVGPLGLQIPTKPSQLQHSHSRSIQIELNYPSTMAKSLMYHNQDIHAC
jgi:hypothetical protein